MKNRPFSLLPLLATMLAVPAPVLAQDTSYVAPQFDTVSVSVSPVSRRGYPHMVASLSEKILYLKEGDSVVATYPIADGTARYPTPRGSFTIRKLTWNPRWVPPPNAEWARKKTAKPPGHPDNPMKVVKLFFKEPDYYIHGTGDVESLGTSASHGCLRMSPEDVIEVGKWVMAHGGRSQPENWFMRLLHSRREEKVIYLSVPVSIRIAE